MVQIPQRGQAAPFSFGGSNAVATPFQFYTSGAENLRIVSVNALVGVTIVVALRLLTEAPEPLWLTISHVPNSDRTVKQTDHPLARGFVLNAIAYVTGASPRIGQTFVQLEIIGGLGGATTQLGTLLQGYVTATQKLAFPGSPVQNSIEGGGVTRLLTGTTPAAGAIVAETVPTGAQWELLAIGARLQTSAAAGDRRPYVTCEQGGATYSLSVLPLAIPPSDSIFGFWSAGMPLATTIGTTRPVAGLGVGLRMLAGDVASIKADGLDAADQFSAVRLLVREWLEAS